jgi:hypothetical protein
VTEEGWYVQYTGCDLDTIAMQGAHIHKQKMGRNDQEKMMGFIVKQIER